MSLSITTSTAPQTTSAVWKKKALFGLGFFLILFVLKLLLRGPSSLLDPMLLIMVIGGILGMGISYLDVLVYAYVTEPEKDFSLHLKTLIKHKKIKEVIQFIDIDASDDRKLATNNVIFLVVWVFLALLVLSSSINPFARGFILGIGLQMSLDIIQDLEKPSYLNKRLFWPIARKVTKHEMKITVYFFLFAFLFLSFFVV